jgi:antitoxin CptB
MQIDHDIRLKKLRFRSWRRGIREADLLLGGFADAHLHELDAGQLDRFELLLEEPDVDLYPWIIETVEAPAAFDTDVLHLIRRFRHTAYETIGGRGG